MRKIILLICFLMPIACNAQILHVGELEFKTFPTKLTEHAIVMRRETGVLEYVPIFHKWYNGTLHVNMDGVVYSACKTNFHQEGHYFFCGDDLVEVDKSVYLESTGTQYIDTGYSAPYGIRVVSKLKWSNIENPIPYQQCFLFGSHNTQEPYGRNYFMLNFNSNDHGCYLNYGAGGSMGFLTNQVDFDTVYHVDISTIIDKRHVFINDVSYDISFSENGERSSNSIWLFSVNGTPAANVVKTEMKNYNMLFYDEYNLLVHHFVPVPAGMQIGDFTVPENGMWDIVEQKFYGNDGTGEFIYGVDE